MAAPARRKGHHPKSGRHGKHVKNTFTRDPGGGPPGHKIPTGGPHPPKSPHLGWVAFEAYSPHYYFECLLGDGSPTPKDGYAGWTTLERSRRRALTQWNGNVPLTIEIPVMFDDFANQQSIEPDIRQLEKMAGLERGMTEPPLVAFDAGGAIPHDATNAPHVDWVISALEWGDADRNRHGNRVRQAATVTVMQFVDEDQLSMATAAQRRRMRRRRQRRRGRAQRGTQHKKYVVKDKETLETIAAKVLGSHKKWRQLKRLNPKIKSPKRVIPIGTIIKLP